MEVLSRGSAMRSSKALSETEGRSKRSEHRKGAEKRPLEENPLQKFSASMYTEVKKPLAIMECK